MDRLPIEILSIVVESLAVPDLSAVRLVNKQLAAAAAPHLFHTVTAWISVRSLQRLTLLSEHPELRHHVKVILMSPLRVVAHKDRSAFEARVRNWLEYQHASLSSLELSVARFVGAYRTYIHGQAVLRAQDLDVKVLCRAFNNFPRFERLIISYHDDYIGAKELIEAFGVFRSTDLLTIDCEITLPVIVQAMSASNAKIKAFELADNRIDIPSDYDRIAHVARSTLRSRRAMMSQPTSAEFPFLSVKSAGSIRAPAIRNAFLVRESYENNFGLTHVKELKVGEMLEVFLDDDRDEIQSTVDGIQNLLRMMPVVESITIAELCMPWSDHFEKLKLGDIFSTGFGPALRKLDITGYDASMEHLLRFFRRQARSLVEVIISWMFITDSSWPAALSQLRDFEFPLLNLFVLDSCSDPDTSMEGDVYIQPYICRYTDQDPTLNVRKKATWRR